MSSRIVHKESLPAQGRIKRRRTEATRPDATETPAEAVDPAAVGAEHPDKEEDEGVTVEQVTAPAPADASSSSSSSSDDDDDEDEVARENERLAQLRARTGGATAGGQSAGEKGGGGAGSYNHDVLFRRADWRQKNAAASGAKEGTTKEDKWRLVVNNKEESANFQTFMKKHFK